MFKTNSYCKEKNVWWWFCFPKCIINHMFCFSETHVGSTVSVVYHLFVFFELCFLYIIVWLKQMVLRHPYIIMSPIWPDGVADHITWWEENIIHVLSPCWLRDLVTSKQPAAIWPFDDLMITLLTKNMFQKKNISGDKITYCLMFSDVYQVTFVR